MINSTKMNRMLGVLALALMLGASSGCGVTRSLFGPKYTVPEKNTPREQALIADRELRQAQQLVDEKNRREAFEKAILAFQTVQERFPDDTVYTPAATLMEGDLNAEIERWRRAEVAYRRTIAKYPNIPDVHAGALLGLGEALYAQNRNAEGNQVLAQLVESYGTTEDPVIRTRVRRAESLRDRVR